jgi:hypothetical protein
MKVGILERNEMKKLDIVKGVTGIIVGLGVGLIVGNAIKATTPDDIGKIGKILIGVGSFALGGILSGMAASHTEHMIDDYAKNIEKIKKALKDNTI